MSDVKTESALNELASQCELASRPDRQLDAYISEAIGKPVYEPTQPAGRANWPEEAESGFAVPRYTASVDAAMALVPSGWVVAEMGEHYDLPLRAKGPWFAVLCEPQRPMNDGGSGGSSDPYSRCQNAPTLALAICAAALRARSA